MAHRADRLRLPDLCAHNFQPSFETVMANDKRAPVVFLRSFADDEKLDYQRADSALFDFSLESRLANHFSSVRPFVAVAAPGDTMPHLGAARARLSDDEWQATVIGWIEAPQSSWSWLEQPTGWDGNSRKSWTCLTRRS